MMIYPDGARRAPLPESLKTWRPALVAFFRSIPKLVEKGHLGKWALLRPDGIDSVWKTREAASRAGRKKYGLEPFLTQPIDPKELTDWARDLPELAQEGS
jgi:hypothetical protein